MRRVRTGFVPFVVCLLLLLAVPAIAGDLEGRIADRSGGVLPNATVTVLNIANTETWTAAADEQGRYRVAGLAPGTYVVMAVATGFSGSVHTVVVPEDPAPVEVNFTLDLGVLRSETTVTAARGARDPQMVPLRIDTIGADAIRTLTPRSTGEVLQQSPGITVVGAGPFQVRPRLRGLDSTRVLVLVNGERLNNSRTATDRAGIEVGLIDVGTVEAVEVLGGAGSVLYGTDALAGTINIITNRPRLSDTLQFSMGFDGLYSSNESGRRGTVRFGVSDRRWAVSFAGGGETYDAYRAGGDFRESSYPLHESGRLYQADTIDDAFGFSFNAFPDPFNAPFERTSDTIPQSRMEGTSADLAGIVRLGSNQDLQFRYQRRHADAVGFPDFEEPFFFQTIDLPWSRLDKVSASYAIRDLTPWLRRVSASAYFQRQDRLLRTAFPVQFPVPSPRFFPINVFRLNIQSDTRQYVETPGFEVQANMQVRPDNVLTAGITFFRDRSQDERTNITQATVIGDVSMGPFGPRANVYDQPLLLGPPVTTHPVRVPNSTFRDFGLFVQDEWDLAADVRLSAGLRLDAYRVVTDPTPGYEVGDIVDDADPPIDPNTLPNVNGDVISRTAVTGEAGLVLWSSRPVSVFGHYVRSYRHPNLEELLFSGPATAGNIVPNVTVKPETGHNVDVGTRIRLPRFVASAAYFHNFYDDFISTEIVSNSPAGTISQAVNFAKVRIQGIETQVDVPLVAGSLNWLPHLSYTWTRGTVLEGESPLTGDSLAGAPQDNITPNKLMASLRVSDRAERWWADYSLRAQSAVDRISPLLSESPYLIAQDLFSLGGFAIQRVAVGYNWRKGNDRLGLTFAVDNLTNRFYREQFQFAPARGRSFTVAVNVGGSR
ncbi:MAG TPA: TonB-dependent receptor [Vicinamibacterales bacterium]|nr:TonB-dependent receptor [Vicinamibacterales bacterium]